MDTRETGDILGECVEKHAYMIYIFYHFLFFLLFYIWFMCQCPMNNNALAFILKF